MIGLFIRLRVKIQKMFSDFLEKKNNKKTLDQISVLTTEPSMSILKLTIIINITICILILCFSNLNCKEDVNL